MISLPPLSSFSRPAQEETASVDTTHFMDPALDGKDNLFEDNEQEHTQDGSQQYGTASGFEGADLDTITDEEFQTFLVNSGTQPIYGDHDPFSDVTGLLQASQATYEDSQATHEATQSPGDWPSLASHQQFNGKQAPVSPVRSSRGNWNSFNANIVAPMASQQRWEGQQGEISSVDVSQGNEQNHSSQTDDSNGPQPPQSEHVFDNMLPSGSYPDSEYSSQQNVFTPQYPLVNNQGYIGGHGRNDSGYNGQQQELGYASYNKQQQQLGPRMSSGNRNRYAEPQFGAENAHRPQQVIVMAANEMHQQFPTVRQYSSNEHRQGSPLVAPQPQRPLPAFVQNHTGSNAVGYGAQDVPENWNLGQHSGSNGHFPPAHTFVGAEGLQYQTVAPQGRANHHQQAAVPAFHNSAPQSYHESLQQPQQGLVNTGRPQASNRRPSRESTVESQPGPAVTIPPNCPIGNLTNYSLDFVRPLQKLIKKAADEHWIDYPSLVLEFFTSPFPEYCLTPQDPNVFLPAVIHVKELSPAQMLEWHARAPQHRDLMHQFIVPRMTGYPNELPGDSPAIKQKKFKNNTISMRQQRLREQNGQFMGDAKISRVAKGEDHKSLTKVFENVLPKINGARLLHVIFNVVSRFDRRC